MRSSGFTPMPSWTLPEGLARGPEGPYTSHINRRPMLNLSTLSNDELVNLLDDANVFGDDAQYDACYGELVKRDALPYYMSEDLECVED